MISLSMEEAQLFRMLVGFFGRDHVIPRMSVMAVCGGELPEDVVRKYRTAKYAKTSGADIRRWAKLNKCLFTIVDRQDQPCMVVEFFSGFEDGIDAVEAEHQQFLKPILQAAGVRYVTISGSEFSELLDPDGTLDFYHLLQDKVG